MSSENFDPNDFIFDANADNFDQLVLENSALGPVLVNFWSRKAGPSFRLYPVLENLITTYSGAFLLVNIDVDDQRSIARDYSITSVPTLKLFVKGKVEQTLFGYQNESDLRFLLDQYVASENDIIIHRALQLFEQGKAEQAYQQLGRAALTSPQYYKLPLTIASLMRSEGRYEEALKLLNSLPEIAREKAIAKRLIIECEFSSMAAPVQDAEDLKPFVRENMDELPAVKLLAAWHVTQGQVHEALQLFEQIMQQDRTFEDDLGRRSIVKILSLIEDGHPLIKHYRDIIRKLNN
jgi:putative thioredoxin